MAGGDDLMKILPLQILHHEKGVAFVLPKLIYRDDALVAEISGHDRLVAKAIDNVPAILT